MGNFKVPSMEAIRIRIMQEAYDLADRNDSEGYNSVKVACTDVMKLINELVSAEREGCARLVDHILREGGGTWGDAIRARGEK